MMREYSSPPVLQNAVPKHISFKNRTASTAVRSGTHPGIWTDNDQKIEAVCLLTGREVQKSLLWFRLTITDREGGERMGLQM